MRAAHGQNQEFRGIHNCGNITKPLFFTTFLSFPPVDLMTHKVEKKPFAHIIHLGKSHQEDLSGKHCPRKMNSLDVLFL
jgi:hypothetical protein